MSLVFHSAAAKKVKEIMGEDPDVTEDTSLRVFIEGGGCSGFQYGFTFDEKKEDEDHWFVSALGFGTTKPAAKTDETSAAESPGPAKQTNLDVTVTENDTNNINNDCF